MLKKQKFGKTVFEVKTELKGKSKDFKKIDVKHFLLFSNFSRFALSFV